MFGGGGADAIVVGGPLTFGAGGLLAALAAPVATAEYFPRRLVRGLSLRGEPQNMLLMVGSGAAICRGLSLSAFRPLHGEHLLLFLLLLLLMLLLLLFL